MAAQQALQRACAQAARHCADASAGLLPLPSWSASAGAAAAWHGQQAARCLCSSSGGSAVASSSSSQERSARVGSHAPSWGAAAPITQPSTSSSSSVSSIRRMSGCAASAAAAAGAAVDLASPALPPIDEAPRTLSELRSKLAQGPNFTDFLTGADLRDGAAYSVEAHGWKARKRKPEWMKRQVLPGGDKYTEIKGKLRELKLHTVCEEARCPNIGECWGGGDGHTATATIMLMGDTCTRGCRFCAVKTSRAPPPLDPAEPANVSKAIAAWGLDYVVLTSVDRDDLPDGGAAHIAETVRRLKQETQGRLLVEALVPDFQGKHECVRQVVEAGLDVFAHNIETVQRLQGVVRDRRAGWEQSLGVLAAAKRLGARVTKSSIMLGCGEAQHEVVDTLRALREHGVDVVTLGQYMQPTKKHMAVSEYVTPQAFAAYQRLAEEMGFLYVASGPMVRSSYRAGEFYLTNVLRGERGGSGATAAAGAAAAAGGAEPADAGGQQQQQQSAAIGLA